MAEGYSRGIGRHQNGCRDINQENRPEDASVPAFLRFLSGRIFMKKLDSKNRKYAGNKQQKKGIDYGPAVLIVPVIAVIGLLIHSRKLKPTSGISNQEVLLWLFVGTIWLAGWMNPPIGESENHAMKITKAALMIFVLRHSVEDLHKFRWLIWALLLASAYGAFDTRLTAARIGSRINMGSGGSDFMEGNFLAAHLTMILPFLGVLFMCGQWIARVFLIAAAAIVIDAIVQCRSRGAFLAVLGGTVVALFFAPHGTRKKIYTLILLAAIGAFALVDDSFIHRMSQINLSVSEELDASAGGRILCWKAGISMAADHPLGIGYNNFKILVGNYEPTIQGKDTHNTYLRCLTELGVQGFSLLCLLIGNALLQIYRLHRKLAGDPAAHELPLFVYASGVALSIYLIAGMFITCTYIEEFYFVLLLPEVLLRIHEIKTSSNAPVLKAMPLSGESG